MAGFGTFTSSGAAVAAARHPRTTETISKILNEMGRMEFARQQRQMREAVLGAMGQGGAPDVMRGNVLSAVRGFEPTYSGGLPGFFQRMAAPYAQQYGSPVQEQVLSSQLSDLFGRKTGVPQIPFGVTPERYAEYNRARIGRGIVGTPARPARPWQEPAEEAKIRSYGNILLKEDTKNETKEKMRKYLRANPAIRHANPTDNDYSKFLEGRGKEKLKGALFDRVYGGKAYEQAKREILDRALAAGWSEESAGADFDRWWDKTVESETGKWRTLKPRRKTKTPVSHTDIRMYSAPDIALDEYWPKLTTTQKKKILQLLDTGHSVDEVIDAIKGSESGGVGGAGGAEIMVNVPGKSWHSLSEIRPGTKLPFDKGYTGQERPGVRLPFDQGYTGGTVPGVQLPFDPGYTGPRAPQLKPKAGEPGAEGVAKPEKMAVPESFYQADTGNFKILPQELGFSLMEPKFQRVGGTPGTLGGLHESAEKIAALFLGVDYKKTRGTYREEPIMGAIISYDEIIRMLTRQVHDESRGGGGFSGAGIVGVSGKYDRMEDARRKARAFGSEALSPEEKALLREEMSYNIRVRPGMAQWVD